MLIQPLTVAPKIGGVAKVSERRIGKEKGKGKRIRNVSEEIGTVTTTTINPIVPSIKLPLMVIRTPLHTVDTELKRKRKEIVTEGHHP